MRTSFGTVFRASLCVSVVLSPVPVFAETIEDTSPILVTAPKLPDVLPVAGGASSIAVEEFEDRLAINLRDTLGYTPGVYLQPRFGQEVRISIRGSGIGRSFHMRGLTLLQDGIPINLADDNGDFQEIDPRIMARIDVIRGGNALRFGGSTLGGAINGITPTGRSAPGMAVRIDGGSFNTVRTMVSAGFEDQRGDAWIALASDNSDGDRDHAKRRSLRFNGNIGIRLSELIETRFYASVQNIDQKLPGGLSRSDALTNPKKGNFFGDQARDIDSIRLQNRTSIDLGKGQAEFGAFVSAKKLHHPIFQILTQNSTDYGAYARIAYDFGALETVIGSTARFGTVTSRRFVNTNGKRGIATFAAQMNARTIDIYAEGRYHIASPLTLIAGAIFTRGIREQRQSFPVTNLGKAGYSEFSPKFGLLWSAAPNIEIYANYSRSAEMPGFIELAQIASFVPLRTQSAWTAEIGTRGQKGIVKWDISLYRANVRGELLQFSTAGTGVPASTFNARTTMHQGIEAGLDIHITKWLRMRQAYQFNDFTFRNDPQYGDNRLPVIPRHMLRTELRLGTDDIYISPNMEWVPQGGFVDYANSQRVPGYSLFGVNAAAAISKNITIFADIRNLTDKKAIGDIAAVVDARTLTPMQQAIFTPIERRAVYVGVRAGF